MAKRRNSEKIRKMTYMAILTALVFTLQLIAPYIKPWGYAVALGIVPMIVGAAMFGPLCGMWLAVAIAGATCITDWASVTAFFNDKPFLAIFMLIAKIVVAGAVCGLVYKLIAKKNEVVAAVVASIVAPVVNTSIFLVCTLLFFSNVVGGWAFIAIVMPNIAVEFLMCPILAPALIRVALAFKRLK